MSDVVDSAGGWVEGSHKNLIRCAGIFEEKKSKEENFPYVNGFLGFR